MHQVTQRFLENQGVRELIDRAVVPEDAGVDEQFAQRRQQALESNADQVEIQETRRIGRNDPCPCNSGRKFKKCCGSRLAADDARVKD